MRKHGDWWITNSERVYNNSLRTKLVIPETDPLWWRGEIEYYKQISSYFDLSYNMFVDVGSSYGFIARPVSKIYKHVYCFEPNPEVYACLKVNMKGIDNVTLHRQGLSNRKNSCLLYTSPSPRD